jgi:hypothetical protein
MSKLKTKREADADEFELDERYVDDDEFVTSDDLKLSKGSHGSYQPKHAEHKFDSRISTAMIVRDQHERKQQSEQETASATCKQKQVKGQVFHYWALIQDRFFFRGRISDKKAEQALKTDNRQVFRQVFRQDRVSIGSLSVKKKLSDRIC